MIKGRCYFCGAEIELADKVYRKDTCPNCGRDLHSCVQCRFYDPSAPHQCKEPVAEPVRDKEKANLCTYFEFAGRKDSSFQSEKELAKKKLEELFKKSS